MRKLLLPIVASLACAAGCYTQGDVGGGAYYGGGGGYYAAGPSMYYYSPGVSVVAYTDDPVFYSDGMYWRYYGDTWYSSPYYNTGWVVNYNVPYGVRGIREPRSYAHFTPGAGWTRVSAGGGYNGGYNGGYHGPSGGYYGTGGGAPVVRDHRTYQPTYAPAARSTPVYRGGGGGGFGGVRDHRH